MGETIVVESVESVEMVGFRFALLLVSAHQLTLVKSDDVAAPAVAAVPEAAAVPAPVSAPAADGAAASAADAAAVPAADPAAVPAADPAAVPAADAGAVPAADAAAVPATPAEAAPSDAASAAAAPGEAAAVDTNAVPPQVTLNVDGSVDASSNGTDPTAAGDNTTATATLADSSNGTTIEGNATAGVNETAL